MPRVAESWLRNWIACMAMYYTVGGLWAYYIYWCFGNVFFGPGKMPGIEDVWNQIQVSPGAAACPHSAGKGALVSWPTHKGRSCLPLTKDSPML